MASVTFTIPDASINRILDGFATVHGFHTDLGLTKTQFLKKEVIAFIKQGIAQSEVASTVSTTHANAQAEIEAISIT